LFAAGGLTFVAAVGGVCLGAETGAERTNLMALSLGQLLEVNVDKVYGAWKYEQNLIGECPVF
jgi:hypothetical protein